MKKSGGSLDTNVLLRLLLNDVPAQHSAAKMLLSEASGQVSVADTAIIELVFVLERHYELTREQIAEATTGILQLKEINANRALFEMALPIYVDSLALSFEDCCLSAYAKIDDTEPLWTFDKKLANQSPSAKLLEN